MRISFYILIFIIYSFPSLSSNKAFYEGRAKFIKEYISELQVLRKKDPDYNGAIAESLTGSFFQALDKKPQNEVEAQDSHQILQYF